MPLPPLVEPAPSLPTDEYTRAARQIRLASIGDVGQRRLAAARVCVLGAGGLGSPVLTYLASAGVGTLGIVDDDTVDLSNLQRQIVFGVDDVGARKTSVAAVRIRSMSPHTRVVEHTERLTAANAAEVLNGYHLVVDGTDNFDTRYAVADTCADLGIPLVWGSVLGFDAQATVFWSSPPAGPGVTLRDVFPAPPPIGEVPDCAEAGVLGALCGQLGSILAAEAVKLIVGIGDPILGRMLVLDGLTARVDEVPLAPPVDGARIRRIDAATLTDPSPDDTVILDVREPDEVAAGAIPGATPVPLNTLLADAAAVGIGALTVVYCQRGPRARVAAAALRAVHPTADIALLDGGYAAWAERTASL
ncbi:MAG: ThiF family adenylyltransferase [Gordonia sp. (in: high G+C Gram-positive bacteria)]|jgi:adenylyltransferase/sulfurtransferase|nr:ThiF family adenylyltransferase [Gordonia sp. (in: high G+C Gram-positive bacteria)]